MATETILNELKINYLTEEQYAQALANGMINDNEIYMTPEGNKLGVIESNLNSHVNNKSNPHNVTANQVGADPAGSANSALTEAKSYTDTKTSGLASTSSVNSKVNTHNTNTSAHNDIRINLSELNTKLNNFLNVTDTTKDQLSEIIQLIEDNADDIESITSGKVNVSDIVNNLTTNVTNKPLSAAQGVALKELIDSHNHSYLSTDTKYALSDSVGGAALQMHISRVTKNITEHAADVPVRTEVIYFCGGDGTDLGCPKTYCIINIKKGDNHRTIMDCYHLQTGNHYINGCMDTRDIAENPWTNWVIQPNQASLDAVLAEAKTYTDTKITEYINEAILGGAW